MSYVEKKLIAKNSKNVLFKINNLKNFLRTSKLQIKISLSETFKSMYYILLKHVIMEYKYIPHLTQECKEHFFTITSHLKTDDDLEKYIQENISESTFTFEEEINYINSIPPVYKAIRDLSSGDKINDFSKAVKVLTYIEDLSLPERTKDIIMRLKNRAILLEQGHNKYKENKITLDEFYAAYEQSFNDEKEDCISFKTFKELYIH